MWPLVARAQQPAMPVIGFLGSASMGTAASLVDGFRRGLKENGFLEGQNVAIEFRWAEGQYDKLPGLAADLLSRRVSVLFGGGPAAAVAAKAATTTIPVVFTSGSDPVKIGLVPSMNRPGGNVTGVSIQVLELNSKRLGLLRELIPAASAIGYLVHPGYGQSNDNETEAAARALGLQFYTANASTEDALDAALASLVAHRISALFVGVDPTFYAWRKQIITLASRASLPDVYEDRAFVVDGGLMSYGPSFSEAYHQAGIYVARIIKGEKPADLPVLQPTKFELVINLKTAKTLGLTVPSGVLAIADDVIE